MIRSIVGGKPTIGAGCAILFALAATFQASSAPRIPAHEETGYRSYKKEIGCLARAVYFEARGESRAGQRAVARVILNRVDSEYYPDTICDVVYQNDHLKNACQFSFACDGAPDRITEPRAFETATSIAKSVFQCEESRCTPRGALSRSTHYHADYVTPWWAKKLEKTGQVGKHIFYYTASM